MDQRGLFVSIYLNELGKLGAEIFSIAPNDNIVSEIHDFTKFLIDIAKREKGDLTNLRFSGENIKVTIILALSENTLSNIQNEIGKAVCSIEAGYNTLYILACGGKREAATMIAQGVTNEHPTFECVNICKYKLRFPEGRMVDAVCIEMCRND